MISKIIPNLHYIIILIMFSIHVASMIIIYKLHQNELSEKYSEGFLDGAERIIRGDYRAIEATERHKKMD